MDIQKTYGKAFESLDTVQYGSKDGRPKGNGKNPAGTEGLSVFVAPLSFVEDSGKAKTSRDRDDDKFIDCAVSSKSLYIVSDEDDLLSAHFYGAV